MLSIKCDYKSYAFNIEMYKKHIALNNLQELTCHKSKQKQTNKKMYKLCRLFLFPLSTASETDYSENKTTKVLYVKRRVILFIFFTPYVTSVEAVTVTNYTIVWQINMTMSTS